MRKKLYLRIIVDRVIMMSLCLWIVSSAINHSFDKYFIPKQEIMDLTSFNGSVGFEYKGRGYWTDFRFNTNEIKIDYIKTEKIPSVPIGEGCPYICVYCGSNDNTTDEYRGKWSDRITLSKEDWSNLMEKSIIAAEEYGDAFSEGYMFCVIRVMNK
jgi:hypothetical protein